VLVDTMSAPARLAAEIRLAQFQILDHRAHAAVEHENALVRDVPERGFDG
jgi:hypothetical protein